MRSPFFETVFDLTAGAETLRCRPYGVIEAADGAFREVRIRPFPKIASVPEAMFLGGWRHRFCAATAFGSITISRGDSAISSFCAYVVSNRDTSLATVRRALDALEEIARLKQSDALLCDAGNWRISAKLLDRLGWAPHCPSRWHRHYIKRFYSRRPRPSAAFA